MKDKIEVNEYVRTRAGHIYKITNIDENGLIYWNKIQCGWSEQQLEYIIVKHSKQLIDLIEVGDIVEIRTGLYSSFKYFVENEDNLLLLEEQVKQFWNIKKILTKEQFEVNCYKVGGRE